MKIEIIQKVKVKGISRKLIKDSLFFFKKQLIAKQILKKPFLNQKLLVVFISSSEMKELNQYYLDKNNPTDVLSFPAVEDNSFGELVLCVQKIKSQAKEHALSFQEEMAYLILHGFLHLLGYHHEEGGEKAKKMYQIQDSIFQSWQEQFID